MIRMASVVALAFGFLSLSVVGFAQDEKKGKGKGAFADPEAQFKRMDENGDGKVSKEEFKKAQNTMAEKMAEAGFRWFEESLHGQARSNGQDVCRHGYQ